MGKQTAQGTEKYVALTTKPANMAAITLTELGNGFDMVGSADDEELEDVQGLELASTVMATEGMASLVAGSVPGPQTIGQVTFLYMAGTESTAIYDEFESDKARYIVKFYKDGAAEAGDTYEVFPMTFQARTESSGKGIRKFTWPAAAQPGTKGVFAS